MKALVYYVHGTIVECNTAYPGRRMESKEHWKAIDEHGFTKLFKVDIMDEEGEMLEILMLSGRHLKMHF